MQFKWEKLRIVGKRSTIEERGKKDEIDNYRRQFAKLNLLAYNKETQVNRHEIVKTDTQKKILLQKLIHTGILQNH